MVLDQQEQDRELAGEEVPDREAGGGGGIGIGGNCVCPSCGAIATHQVGVPCNSIKCPKCGAMMVRQ